ncbi:hypothetical protein SASPL_111644 [Salvia splendens]|uniref:C3H1-type domain-containing protein n=1 Tax=Salvia splendens TaxID=180675 RepID=A0A8X8YCB1_SALSN|nr:hypothetical protein SASPL_111644 [Salvia splendens]
MPPKQSKADIAKKQKARLNLFAWSFGYLRNHGILFIMLSPGVDPKSILCEHLKVGQCAKGFKCKFSHDLNVQRKGEKIDIYSDTWEEEQGTMEDWDQETLEKVVASKSNEYNKNKPTDIVCKYFLEAVEKKQYGWFWVCPNGSKECHYRHALPPGYVLKSQMKALLEEEAQKITIDGRELFLLDASLFVDDAEAYDKYQREEEEPDVEQKTDNGAAMDWAKFVLINCTKCRK